MVNEFLDGFDIWFSSGVRVISNIYPFVPLYRKNEPKIQMSLQVDRCSKISKANLFCIGGCLPFWDFIFLRIPGGVRVGANELMFLWEVTLKDLGWRWHECLSIDISLWLSLTLGDCSHLDN